MSGVQIMDIKALIDCNTDVQNIINELNNESKICKYELLKQTNLSMPEDIIIIIFEILKNLGANAIYDMLKASLLEIVSKILVIKKQKSMSKAISIIVIVNEKKTEVVLPFELNEEQKSKVVDAAINKLFD